MPSNTRATIASPVPNEREALRGNPRVARPNENVKGQLLMTVTRARTGIVG